MTENPFKNKILKIYLFDNDGFTGVAAEIPLDDESEPPELLHLLETGLRPDSAPIRAYAWKIVEK